MATSSGTHHTETGHCTVCGATATAYWSGRAIIEVCSDCAVKVLPSLIADAIPNYSADAAKIAIENASLYYWRALALRMMRERDAERRRRMGEAGG